MMDYLKLFQGYLRCERGLSDDTIVAYSRDISDFLQWALPIGRPHSAKLVEEYLSSLRGKYAPRYIQRRRIAIMQFYRVLARHKVISPEQALLISPVKSDHADTLPCLTADQVKRLVSSFMGPCATRNVATTMIMYSSGLRVSEVCGLFVRDIRYSQSSILVRGGKGGIDRVVPTSNECLESIKEYERVFRNPHAIPGVPNLFISRAGQPLARQTISETIFKGCKKAGLPGRRSHSLRRTCGSSLLANGADVEDVRDILGHSSLKDTQKYIVITPDHLREQVRNFHPSFQNRS